MGETDGNPLPDPWSEWSGPDPRPHRAVVSPGDEVCRGDPRDVAHSTGRDRRAPLGAAALQLAAGVAAGFEHPMGSAAAGEVGASKASRWRLVLASQLASQWAGIFLIGAVVS